MTEGDVAGSAAGDNERRLRTVRRYYTLFNRRQEEALFATLHPEVVVVMATPPAGGVAGATWEGHEGVSEMIATVRQRHEHIQVVILEMTPTESGRVIASVMINRTVRTTNVNGIVPTVHVFGFRDGLIDRIEIHRLN